MSIDFYDEDRERVDLTPAPAGAPVDPPDERRTVYATVMTRTDMDRRPIVPGWARNRHQRRLVARWAAGYGGYTAAYHATRTPKYTAKVLFWAPVGAVRLTGRALHWAFDLEGFSIRQDAATRNDVTGYLALSRQRDRRVAWRAWVLGACAVSVAAAVVALLLLPGWVALAVAAIAVPALAWAGRPADRPITDRVSTGPRFIKLTADMVRAALVAAGAGVKDPTAVQFPREIVRDPSGRGYLAVAALPPGVVATDVIDRRDRLAAGFKLPVDQVWPATIRGEHPGIIEIYVSDRPVSAMRQPPWPLLTEGTVDYFEPYPYGADVRLRPVTWSLAERNSLFGGVPGSGKSLAARNVLLGAVLDPLVIPAISELKGSGDYDMFEPLCPRGLYVSGADEGSLRRTLAIIEWLYQLCEERGPIIAQYARQGLNTTKKVNRAMAERDERLRPVVAMFDEVQEFMSSPYGIKGPGAGMLLSVIKRGRALGIHIIVATQRFDKDSLPKAISSLVTNRACLAVPAQPETDMVLGTSAYRTGARPTAFVPGEDSGWMVRAGFTAGFETVRAAYVDDDQAAAVCQRALALRNGQTPDTTRVRVQARNLLDDVRQVWPAGEDRAWSEAVVPLLRELDPTAYADLTVETFGARMRAAGVPTEPLHRKIEGKGVTRAGVRLDSLDTALNARQITDR